MKWISARTALLLALSAIFTSVTVDRLGLLIVLAAVPLVAVGRSTRNRSALMRHFVLVTPLVAITAIARALAGAPLSQITLPALRVVSAIAWSTWLARTHAAHELECGLRALGVSRVLVDLIAQTRLFGAQLAGTLIDAWNAAVLRGGATSSRATFRTLGAVAGVVVVRALDRAERVAVASALRGAALRAKTTAPSREPSNSIPIAEAP